MPPGEAARALLARPARLLPFALGASVTAALACTSDYAPLESSSSATTGGAGGSDATAAGGGAASSGGGGAATCDAQLALGIEHSCARDGGGGVTCWGANGFGQLGDGTTLDSASPVAATGLPATKHLATRFRHACAATSAGAVWCWGQNDHGQVGAPLGVVPVEVIGVDGADEVSVGRATSCARRRGVILCWGNNDSGELGNGSTSDSLTPVPVYEINTAVQVAAGDLHACAVLSDGAARCWGANESGQLGNATNLGSAIPVAVSVAGTVRQIVAGGSGGEPPDPDGSQSCALLEDGTVWCWGDNQHGQLGDGTSATSWSPVKVSALEGVVEIAMGRYHVCARRKDGAVVCWGGNNQGQLGDGSNIDRSVPALTDIVDAVQIAAGGEHTCALLQDGSLHCWGKDAYGQLGDGEPGAPHVAPVESYDVCGRF